MVFGGEVDDVPVVFKLVDAHFADADQALLPEVAVAENFSRWCHYH